MTLRQKTIIRDSNLALSLMLEAEEAMHHQEVNSDDAGVHDAPGAPQQEPQQQEPQPQPQQQDPRDIFSDQIQGVEEKFVQFVLYDKLGELSSKIAILQENIKNDTKDNYLELGAKLDHYAQYLEVLNELIFSMDTSVIYQLMGQIELELIELLQKYDKSEREERKNK